MSLALSRPGWWVLCISLAITLLPAPWVLEGWVAQGDEPHYLLAAHSLVFDGDLDLANNYAQGDFRRFYPGPIDLHVRYGVDGRAYLSHDIGLSILIAPAYALGGRSGVVVFLACVAALTAVNVFGLALQVTANRKAALVTWFIFGVTPLLSVYAYLVYPEMVGALLVTWSVRQIAFRSPPDVSRRLPSMLVLAAAIGSLPWFSARYIPIAAFLGLWAARRRRSDRRSVFVLGGVLLLSAARYLAANAWMGGGSSALDFQSDQIARGFQNFTVDRLPRGLFGWWLDQQRGVLTYSPIHIIALIGLPILWRRLRGAGLGLLMPLALAQASAALWGGFWVGWEISARYLVIGLPLLAAPMALAVAEHRAWAFRGLAAVLFAVSLSNTALILSAPGVAAYRESVVWIYDRRAPMDLWRALPAMGGGARVDPDPGAVSVAAVVADDGRMVWRAPLGRTGVVVPSSRLKDLTIGSYELRFDARVSGRPKSDAPLLSVDVFSVEGVFLLHRVLTGSDFPADASYRSFVLPFQSPFYNKWGYPVYAQVSTSGLAETWISPVTVTVDAGRTWLVVGVWVGLIGLLVAAFDRSARRREVGR